MTLMLRFLITALLVASAGFAQQDDWHKPFPAHRMIANVYYVGTTDLASYLITTPQGHILINTGVEDALPQLKKSITDLGFKVTDIRILLTNQAHFDHVAAMAGIKKDSGAKLYATEGDARLLNEGGKDDYLFGSKYTFPSAKVDRVLKDGETVSLDGTKLQLHLTPGHTPGSATYTMQVKEDGRSYDVCFANMNSINPGTVFVNNSKYPKIAEDYAHAFDVQKKLHCDVWFGGHASQFNMAKKYKAVYDAKTYVDPDGYKKAVAEYEEKFHDQTSKSK